MQLCFATNNKHKLSEISQAVGLRFKIVSLEELSVFEELPETRDTLEGNAEQKALFVFEKTAVPCFADDTGLEVASLNGSPGVYSARYAGPERDNEKNIDLLLKNLQDKPDRSAYFRTIIALVGMGNHTKFFEGRVDGQIITNRRGSGGFGYDSVFIPNGFNVTFAEMSLEEKNRISHRAIATGKLLNFLKSTGRSL